MFFIWSGPNKQRCESVHRWRWRQGSGSKHESLHHTAWYSLKAMAKWFLSICKDMHVLAQDTEVAPLGVKLGIDDFGGLFEGDMAICTMLFKPHHRCESTHTTLSSSMVHTSQHSWRRWTSAWCSFSFSTSTMTPAWTWPLARATTDSAREESKVLSKKFFFTQVRVQMLVLK